jgi:hypothetical protein
MHVWRICTCTYICMWMYMFIHLCIYVCMHVCIYVCICVSMCTHIYVYIYIYVHIHIHTYIHARTYACIGMYIYIYIYIYYISVFTCATHTYIQVVNAHTHTCTQPHMLRTFCNLCIGCCNERACTSIWPKSKRWRYCWLLWCMTWVTMVWIMPFTRTPCRKGMGNLCICVYVFMCWGCHGRWHET